MITTRLIRFGTVCALFLATSQTGLGQGVEPGGADGHRVGGFGGAPVEENYRGGKEVLTVQVYPVSDLVVPTPNYSFRGIALPSVEGGSSQYDNAAAGSEGDPYGGGMGLGGGMGGGYGGGGGGVFSVGGNLAQFGGGGGGGYAGGGGMGGMGGGGMAATTPRPQLTTRITLNDLVEVIRATVAPESWDQMGGSGQIYPLGAVLVIRQTQPVHRDIAGLIEALKGALGKLRTVTVEAHWILVNREVLDGLVDAKASGRRVLRADAMSSLPEEAIAAAGQVTCFDGQTVHILAGRVMSSISSVVPVVGQKMPLQPSTQLVRQTLGTQGSDLSFAILPRHILAQQQSNEDSDEEKEEPQFKRGRGIGGGYGGGGYGGYGGEGGYGGGDEYGGGGGYGGGYGGGGYGGEGGYGGGYGGGGYAGGGGGYGGEEAADGVGYQPLVKTTNFGALLQVTPSLQPGGDSVVLDLRSIVTQLGPPAAKEAQQRRGGVSLEKTNVVVQQYMTTLRMPIDKPILIGGATVEPGVGRDRQNQRLFLVVQAAVD